jgi:hypothetical protein
MLKAIVVSADIQILRGTQLGNRTQALKDFRVYEGPGNGTELDSFMNFAIRLDILGHE